MIEQAMAGPPVADPGVLRAVYTIHGDERYGDEPDDDDALDAGGRAGRAPLAATMGAGSSSP
jgi:hypothetical protein